MRALLLVLGALGLMAPAPAAAATIPVRGVQLHQFYSDRQVPGVLQDVARAKQLGVNTIRFDLPWPSLEIRDGHYDQDQLRVLDETVRAMAPGKVMVTLFQTPCWASSGPLVVKGRRCTFQRAHPAKLHPPREPRKLGEVAAFLARRYGARGLAGIEVWNEPDLPNFLQIRGPRTLDRLARPVVQMTRAVHRAVKRVEPDVPIVAGAIQMADVDFVRALYRQGLRGTFDVLSMHAYTLDKPPNFNWPDPGQWEFRDGIPRVRAEMVRNGDTAKPMWLTEFGWPTCRTADISCVNRSEQARYLADAVRQLAGLQGPELARPYVEGVFAYELRDREAAACRECQYGLMTHQRQPKPSFWTYRAALADVS